MTSATTLLRELTARIGLSQGSPTLLLLVVRDDQRIDDTSRRLAVLLRAASLNVIDLGRSDTQMGPARWAEASRKTAADAYLITVAPAGPLSLPLLSRLLNAQRQDLRDLAGPLLMLLSQQNEAPIREVAPDFFTWVAQSYEVPPLEELASLAGERGAASVKEGLPAPAPEEPPIRFLHLSDIHLRPGATKRYDQDRVLGGLLGFLEQDRESAPLDLIFVTGDLAFSGKRAEYENVSGFLRRVLEATSVPPAHLFVVPGNHDADRDVGRWMLRTLDSDEMATSFFVEPESRLWHAKKFMAYREHLCELCGPSRPLGLGVGADAVEVVEVRGEQIAIASFNSAWFAHDDGDREKLWLGEANVAQAGHRIREFGGAALSIALMHHPTSFLSEIERDAVEHHLERSFDIVLRGHLHRDRTRVIQSPRGGYLEAAAAAAYQGSQWPNGCFLGEIRPRARTVRLRPYGFSSGADPWVLDPKVFPDNARTGYCHDFSLGERRDKLGLDAALEAETPEVLRSLDRSTRLKLGRSLGVTGKTNREVEEKAMAALQRSADPTDLWATLEATGQSQERREAAYRVAERLASSMPAPPARIPVSDPAFLEKALEAFATYWREHGSTWTSKFGTMERTCMMALHAFLLRWLDGPVKAEGLLGAGHLRPDIFIGSEGGRSDRNAVIEIKHAGLMRSALAQLDQYMDVARTTLGAVVLFDAIDSPEKTESTLEHVSTPAGRDVLLLRL